MGLFHLDKNKLYIISPFGLGDTFILSLLRPRIKERYGYDVVLVIKHSHIAIVDIFSIEYIENTFTEAELLEIGQSNLREGIKPGTLFVGHPHYINQKLENDFFDHSIGFIELYEKLFDVDNPQKMLLSYPEITNDLVDKICPYRIEDIVLFAPDLTSCYSRIDRPNKTWLVSFGSNLSAHDPIVINSDDNEFKFGKRIDMSLRELISICIRCKKVISVRSGLCDVIYPVVKKMDVIYGTYDSYINYSLKRTYSMFKNDGVREYMVSYAEELKNLGFDSCAIYGYGKDGKRLIKSMTKEGFKIEYAIDRKADEIKSDIKIFGPGMPVPRVPCIVSTINRFDEVKSIYEDDSVNLIDFWNLKCSKGVLYEIN